MTRSEGRVVGTFCFWNDWEVSFHMWNTDLYFYLYMSMSSLLSFNSFIFSWHGLHRRKHFWDVSFFHILLFLSLYSTTSKTHHSSWNYLKETKSMYYYITTLWAWFGAYYPPLRWDPWA